MFAGAIMVSEDAGLAKPDPAIFALGACRIGVPADACAFVGDSIATDVRGAQAAGHDGRPVNRRNARPCPAGAFASRPAPTPTCAPSSADAPRPHARLPHL